MAAAASAEVPYEVGVPISSTLKTPVLAEGRAPAGALTVLMVDPTQTEMGHGDMTPVPLSQVRSTGGSFALRAGEVPARDVLDGAMNFQTFTFKGDDVWVGAFTETNIEHPTIQRVGGTEIPMRRTPGAVAPQASCSTRTLKTANANILVGQTFSTRRLGKMDFTYSSGASTVHQIGISYDNGGTWSKWKAEAGSLATATATATLQYGMSYGPGNIYYRAYFGMATVEYLCVQPIKGGGYAYEYKRTNVLGFEGAGVRERVTKPPFNARVCDFQDAGAQLWVNRSKALTWTNGFDVGALGLDLSLSSQTGYTQEADRTTCGTRPVATGGPVGSITIPCSQGRRS